MTDQVLLREKLPSGMLRLSINRPERRNAVNDDVHAEFRSALNDLHGDDSVKGLIITATGDKAFCSGQDLAARKPAAPGEPRRDLGAGLEKNYNALIRRLTALPIPVVVALNGVAAGAGAGLAMGGDLIVAARSSSMAISFGKVGLMPDAGVTFHLPRAIGVQRSIAASLLATRVDAETLERWGLVWQVVDDDKLQETAEDFALQLAQVPPKALISTRHAMRQSPANSLDEQLALERDLQRDLGFSDDYGEGVTAFLEKRKPVFSGR